MVRFQNLQTQFGQYERPLTPDLANQMVETAVDFLDWANWFAGWAHEIAELVNAPSSPEQPGVGKRPGDSLINMSILYKISRFVT